MGDAVQASRSDGGRKRWEIRGKETDREGREVGGGRLVWSGLVVYKKKCSEQ